MWSIPKLPLLSDLLWTRVVVPVRVWSMGQIELFNISLWMIIIFGHLNIFSCHRRKIFFWRKSYLPTPPLGQDMTQGQFLSKVQQVWFQSFPSPRLVDGNEFSEDLACFNLLHLLNWQSSENWLIWRRQMSSVLFHHFLFVYFFNLSKGVVTKE